MSRDPYYTFLFLSSIVLLSDCKRYEVRLDPKFVFGWEVNNNSINLDSCVETTGYVGIGISERGKMDGADMSIGGVKDSGKTYFGIYHGKHHKPVLDKRQNWRLLEASENSTHTFVKYTRLLDTGDSQNIPIYDNTTYIIWAIGKSDDIKKHHGHGKYGVNLIHPSTTQNEIHRNEKNTDSNSPATPQSFGQIFRSYASTFFTLYNLL